MHDWSYMSFKNDFGDLYSKSIKDPEKAKQCFNYEDNIWQLYKSLHIELAGLDLNRRIAQHKKDNTNKVNTANLTPGELLTIAQSQLDNQKAQVQFEQHLATITTLKEAI